MLDNIPCHLIEYITLTILIIIFMKIVFNVNFLITILLFVFFIIFYNIELFIIKNTNNNKKY